MDWQLRKQELLGPSMSAFGGGVGPGAKEGSWYVEEWPFPAEAAGLQDAAHVCITHVMYRV